MSASAGPDIITDGLVLCLDAGNRDSYPGSGSTWRDISNNGNNGTLTNSPTFNSANGGSIVFDGVNDFINISYNRNFTNYTFSIWLKIISTPPTDTAIIDEGNTGIPIRFLIRSNQIRIQHVEGFGATAISYTQNLLLNVWENWTVTHNNTNIVLYRNSIRNAQGTLTLPQATRALIGISGKPLGSSSGIAYLPSNVSNVQIYNRALTPQEVLQNYNATKSRFFL